MSDFNPWRFAQPLELRNMMSAASHCWERAVKDGDTDLAAKITAELEPVAHAIQEQIDLTARVAFESEPVAHAIEEKEKSRR